MAEPLLNRTCGSVAAGSNRTFVGVVNFRVCADAAAAAAAAAAAESACAASTVACWMRSTATSVDDGRFPPDEGRLTPDGGRSREDGRDDMPYGEPHELAYVRTNPVCSAATRPVVHSRAWGRPSR